MNILKSIIWRLLLSENTEIPEK